MSVLKNKRSLSPHQYVVDYESIRYDICTMMDKVSKRHRSFVSYLPITDIMDKINHRIVMLDTRYAYSTNQEKLTAAKETINFLYKLSSKLFPLIILCNDISQNFILTLEQKFNSEFNLLYGLYNKLNEGKSPMTPIKISLYDKKRIEGVIFLEKMSELNKQIISKSTHIPHDFEYLLKKPMFESSMQAFQCAYNANLIFPDNNNNIAKRLKLFKHALAYMQVCEKTVFNFLYTIPQDEIVVKKISELISEINKLLKSIIKSDQSKITKKK